MQMIITKESIIALLSRNDNVGMNAVGRALVAVLKNQTNSERQVQATTHQNGEGFTTSDAKRGTGCAEFYLKTGFLTPKQLAYWQDGSRVPSGRPRIHKYHRQLLDAAQQKQKEKEMV
jgi:hypothetical protein